MCDYSLEAYRSRPACAGEQYESHRFWSGSVGFIAQGDTQTAICMACDVRLELSDIPAQVQALASVASKSAATFTHVEAGPYRDGVRFDNGREVSLQQLGPGVKARVIDAMTEPLTVAVRPAKRALEHAD